MPENTADPLDELESKIISVNTPVALVEAIDDIYDNRSKAITEAMWSAVLDEELFMKAIEEKKAERDKKIAEKQKIEREIEKDRDEIREMQDKLTEVRTLARVRKEISERDVMDVRRKFADWQKEWERGDPRAPTKIELIETKAEKIADDRGIKESHVVTVLRAKLGV